MPKLEPTLLRVLLWAAIAASAAACGSKIGDDCRTSIDCSLEGNRSCDISQPGGYCTVQGCDTRSCPDESMCVRFFPARFLTQPCDPVTEDVSRNECAADELCLESGLCAPRASERRYCALKCENNGDCRGDYECRLVGEQGSSSLDARQLGRARFCGPRASTEGS